MTGPRSVEVYADNAVGLGFYLSQGFLETRRDPTDAAGRRFAIVHLERRMNIVTVDTAGTEPPYEQVRRQIAEGAATGALAAGHKLPTVRQLATDLGLAANTVAKAYRALEE